MTLDEFYMYSAAARRTYRQDMVRQITAMRIAMGANEKEYKQIMKEMEL